jgi:hypothetical protein
MLYRSKHFTIQSLSTAKDDLKIWEFNGNAGIQNQIHYTGNFGTYNSSLRNFNIDDKQFRFTQFTH